MKAPIDTIPIIGGAFRVAQTPENKREKRDLININQNIHFMPINLEITLFISNNENLMG